MDIREELALFKGGLLAKSDSLLLSDQNKLPNEDSGVVNATSSVSPRKRWIPSSMRQSVGQPANKVLNPTPLSKFNPYEKLATVVAVKAPVVTEKLATADVQEKYKAPVVTEKLAAVAFQEKEKEKEKEKVPVVQEKALSVVQEKEKVQVDVVKVISDVVTDLANEKPKDKPREKEKDRPAPKFVSQVKTKAAKVLSESPILRLNKPVVTKDKPKDKRAPKSVSLVKTKAAKVLSEVPVLRLNKPVKEEDKPKRKRVLSKVDQCKKKAKVKLQKDTDDFQDPVIDRKKKNLKSKVVVKRKRDNLGSDSSDSEQVCNNQQFYRSILFIIYYSPFTIHHF